MPFNGSDSMTQYTENEKQRLLSFPLVDLLSTCGKRVDHKGYMYYSPFREEDTPSFHIDTRTNRWFDFGTSEGGGVVELVCRLFACERAEVLDKLADIDTNFVHIDTPVQPQSLEPRLPSNSISILKVSDRITRYALVDYATVQRGVPIDILEKFCKEVRYSLASRRDTEYFAIGFPNNSGGYVLRSAKTKICSSSEISTLDKTGRISDRPTGGRALVFEGFFDMLAWRTMFGRESLDCDVCVLNSVSNWKRAVDWLCGHQRVDFCLDNDDAGKRTLSDISNTIKENNGNLELWDMSPTYSCHKDVGDMLASQLAQRNCSLTLK